MLVKPQAPNTMANCLLLGCPSPTAMIRIVFISLSVSHMIDNCKDEWPSSGSAPGEDWEGLILPDPSGNTYQRKMIQHLLIIPLG